MEAPKYKLHHVGHNLWPTNELISLFKKFRPLECWLHRDLDGQWSRPWRATFFNIWRRLKGVESRKRLVQKRPLRRAGPPARSVCFAILKKVCHWALVVALLVERLLPISEVRGSNPVIGKILYWTFNVNSIEKTKIKKKRAGMALLKKVSYNILSTATDSVDCVSSELVFSPPTYIILSKFGSFTFSFHPKYPFGLEPYPAPLFGSSMHHHKQPFLTQNFPLLPNPHPTSCLEGDLDNELRLNSFIADDYTAAASIHSFVH